MLNHYILSYFGEDRPGLVNELADLIAAHRGNWLESRIANLAGKFTGVVRFSVEAGQAQALEQALRQANREDLTLTLARAEPVATRHLQRLTIKVIAADRPGIVRELTTLLSRLQVNVEELQTDVAAAPMTGEPVFQAFAEISVDAGLGPERLQQELEGLSDDLMVEVEPGI